jgi:hypothetical protein
MIKKFFKAVDWINFLRLVLSVIFLFYINFYLVNTYILGKEANKLSDLFQTSLTFEFIAYLLSIIGISFYIVKDFNKSFLIKITSGYLIYQVISYFILVTRNLNNEDFKTWDFTKNHFFQSHFLLTFLFIIGISALLSFFIQKTNYLSFIENYLDDFDSNAVILPGLMSSIIINDRQMLKIFKDLVSSFVSNNDYSQYMTHLSINLFLSLVVMGIISSLGFKSYQAITTNTPTPSVMVTLSLLLAVIFNYALQLGVRSDEALLGNFIFPGATAYQIIVLTILFLVIYLVLNRILSATLLVIAVGVIISVVNIIKVGLRSEPLLITDFVWLKEFSLITSFVDKTVIIYIVFGLFVTLSAYFILRKKVLPGKIFVSGKNRLISSAIVLSLAISILGVLKLGDDSELSSNLPIISKIYNSPKIDWMGAEKNASYKSLMYMWTVQMTKSIMDRPEGYSEVKIKEITDKYSKEAHEINKTRTQNIEDQTVIFVLSESFANPKRLSKISLSQDVIPFIESVKSNYTGGLMRSDFYGGGTVNMEMQALLGIPYSNLSPSISSFTTEVIPKMSYLPSISNSFDSNDKYIIHLENASNYSRSSIYKRMKFNTFIAEKGSDYKPKKVVLNDGNASDASSYNTVLDNIDVRKNQFFQLVTMQNHLPWGKDNPAELNGHGEGYTDIENTILSRYSRDLKDTDDMTADFLGELSKINKNITVVFYGDHLPGLYPEKTFTDAPESKYETDYFIWSNFETEKLNYPVITSSNFPALLLKETNSKVSPYYALLTDVLDESVLTNEKLTKKQEEIKKDLQIVQYDITLGRGYLTKKHRSFFELDGE